MNKLYKTYLIWRYLSNQKLTDWYGARIKFGDASFDSDFNSYESDHILVLCDNTVQSPVTTRLITGERFEFNSQVDINQLEINYYFTTNYGLMFNPSITIKDKVEACLYVDNPVALINFDLKSDVVVTTGLYVGAIVPMINFSLEHSVVYNIETTQYPADFLAVNSIAENDIYTSIDDNLPDDLFVNLKFESIDENYQVLCYDANIFGAISHDITDIDSICSIDNYDATKFGTSIKYLYDLDMNAIFEIQESQSQFLEFPTIYLAEGNIDAELVAHTSNVVGAEIETNNLVIKPFPILFNGIVTEVEIPINTDVVPALEVDLDNPPIQFNTNCILDEECDVESYFIYSTYAKLNEYWDNTYTLNSMGSSTMDSLTYHEYSYN